MSVSVEKLLTMAGILLGVLALAPLLIWVERRLLGVFQDRKGPNRVGPAGLLQPAADAIKLLTKEDWIPPFADRPVFVIAPAIVAATGLMSFAVVPVGPGMGIVDMNVGLLFFLAMASLGVYSVVLSGWASNNKYSLLGSLRSAAQMLTYEVFMGLSLMGVVMLAGSFDLREIVAAQSQTWFVLTQPVGFLIFLIAGVAETHRLPLDLPEAESELVAGYHSEYSSMKFGLFFIGEYVGMVLVGAIVTTVFLGGWHGPLLPPLLWFFLKTMAVVLVFVLLRASLPRPRYDQLLSLGWKYLLPLSLLNVLATGAYVVTTG